MKWTGVGVNKIQGRVAARFGAMPARYGLFLVVGLQSLNSSLYSKETLPTSVFVSCLDYLLVCGIDVKTFHKKIK